MNVNFREKDISILFFAAFFLTFNFFIYGPIEIYITNISELWFSMGNILPFVLLIALIVFLILSFLGFVLPKRFFELYNCLLVGIALGFYIQGNWIKIDYGVLDGRDIDWASYSGIAVWDTLLWIFCLVLPFVIKYIFKTEYKKYIKLGTVCILLMQIITLGILIFTTDFGKYENDDYYLTDKNLYTISNNKNVIIFVLDTFDERFLEEIIEQEPNFLDEFDGFTYYTNATCSYPTTKGSMPYILTGQLYKNEQEYSKYIKEAYKQTDYYALLSEANYNIGLYTMDLFVSGEAKASFVNNAVSGNIHVNSSLGLEMSMLRFTAFRYFPHVLKKNVWFYSDIFNQYRESTSDFAVFNNDNLVFYNDLISERLKTINDKNVYHLIHLLGTHPPYNLNSDITISETGEATYISQGKACLNIMKEYLFQLKQLGVYDDSFIIITADHGEAPGFMNHPIFLMKNFGEHGSIGKSELPISHSNIMPTILDVTELADKTDSIYNISGSDNIVRKYFYYWWDPAYDKEYLPDITEYEIDNTGGYSGTGKKYTKSGEIYDLYNYTNGEIIYFTHENNGTRYFFNGGISYVESGWAWSIGNSSKMYLELSDFDTESNKNNLIAEFDFKYIYGQQHLIIKAGSTVLYDDMAKPNIQFEIPIEFVDNGTLTLDLEYPNAVSPAEINDGEDTRVLAVAFKSICFTQDNNH